MTNPIKEKEIELLKDIREYTFNNKELLNAHHFMFACPVKRNGNPADIIICGINPGGDPKGKDYRKIFVQDWCGLKTYLKSPFYKNKRYEK